MHVQNNLGDINNLMGKGTLERSDSECAGGISALRLSLGLGTSPFSSICQVAHDFVSKLQ